MLLSWLFPIVIWFNFSVLKLSYSSSISGKQIVKIVAWYDNEMGYTAQMVRTAKYLMEK